MDPKDKIEYFQTSLLDWYKSNGRKFPWRNKSLSNYRKIVIEVLLQRTKAETVSKFYDNFFNKYTNWKSISTSSLVEIEESLKPIGLYRQRATRLKSLAEEMVSRNGRIPNDYSEIIELPMVGQYIANSVMSVIFDKPYPMLDVNMARVLERYFGPRKLADIRYDPYLQELAYQVVNLKNPKMINWAILDFASKVCKAKNPTCRRCQFAKSCQFYNDCNN